MEAGNRKPEENAPDPDQLAKMLELELIQKRFVWQQNKQRFGSLRAASFVFLFLVIVGALVGVWFLFSSGQVGELRAQHHSPTPAPSASPY